MAINILDMQFVYNSAVLSFSSHIDPIAPMPQSNPAGKGYTTFKLLHTHCQHVHVGGVCLFTTFIFSSMPDINTVPVPILQL